MIKKKKLADWLSEKDWNIHGLFRKDSAGINGVQMDARAHMLVLYTHIQKQETHTAPPPVNSLLLSHNAMHFIYNKVFLWGIHLSKLFSSHFCHISLSVPSWPLFYPPFI